MRLPASLKPGLWGAAAGALALSIVGFNVLGWTTAETADRLATETANTAVVAALVPFCVIKAEADPNVAALLTKLRAEQSTFSRTDIVMRAGWATLGNETTGSTALALACGEKLHVTKTS